MSNSPVVRHSVDAEGLGWIVFDDPAGRANVFNPTVQQELHAAIDAVSAAPVRAVVIMSGKERIFIAGADLKWLGRIADAAEGEKAARGGQLLFDRLAKFKAPVVCAIHGACAGGGYELALACDWRLVSDAKETLIGLPEVGIGLIPGWGGSTRLPRLVGVAAAVDHIIKAALVPAADALAAGLVDEVAPAAELRARARAAALRLAAEGRPNRPAPPAPEPDFLAAQRKLAARRMRGQPAPLAVLDAIGQGLGQTVERALEIEAAHFGVVAATAEAHNLVHFFFLKDAAKKRNLDVWFPAEPAAAPIPPVGLVGIIGAGVMGSGIAQWCAARGIGVMMCDADPGALKMGVEVVRDLFKQMVARGKTTSAAAHKAIGGIGITRELEDFCDCDLVIEAITENVAVKQRVHAELARHVRPDCVIASNTSALPIEEIMAGVPGPERTIGLHFFNPVGRMPLVEMVLAPKTSRATAARTLSFVQALGKSPVICRSSPGFYVTRGLFFYLNAACRLWEEGVSTEAIDAAMRDWGWPMGPMRLIDEVGVDVSDFIYGEMKHYYPGRFDSATICQRLLAAGLKGRKNGASSGFYLYGDAGERTNPAVAQFAPDAAKVMSAEAIQRHLNGVLIDETRRVLAEGVLKSADDADFALLMGAGFPAWRGGLMRYAAATGA